MRYHEILSENAYDDLERYVRYSGPIPQSVIDLIPQHPSKAGVLYRGLSFVSKNHYDSAVESLSGGIFRNPMASSWTTELSAAREFATMEKSYDPTPTAIAGMREMSKTGDFTYAYGGIVVKINAPAGAGLDVSKAIDNSAEAEVILPRGEYAAEIEEIIVPWRRQYDTHEKIQQLYNSIMSGTDQDKIHFFDSSILPHLSPEQATAYADKLTGDNEELFHWVVYSNQMLDLRFKSTFDADHYGKLSPAMQTKVGKEANVAAKKFAKEIMAMPDEAFFAERSGIFAEGLMFASEWKAIARPIAARVAKLYHGMNDGARDMKTDRDIHSFGKRITTLLSMLKLVTTDFHAEL